MSAPERWAPPRRLDPGAPPGDDVEALTPRVGVRAAWVTVAACGLLCALAGLQLLLAVTFADPILRIVPFAHLGIGVAAIFAGLKLSQLRRWAAIAAAAISGLIALAGGAWLVYAFGGGLVSLIGALVPLGGIAGAITAGPAIGPCARADAARARLFGEGDRRLY